MSNNQRVSKQVFGMKLGGWCFNHRGIPRCCHRRRPRFLSFGHRSMLCFPWFFWVNDWSWAMMNHNDMPLIGFPEHPWTSRGSLNLGPWFWYIDHVWGLGGKLIAKPWEESQSLQLINIACVAGLYGLLALRHQSLHMIYVLLCIYLHTHMDAFICRESVARLSCVRTINPSGFWTQSNNQHSRSTKWARPGVWSHDIPMVSDDSSAGVALSQL